MELALLFLLTVEAGSDDSLSLLLLLLLLLDPPRVMQKGIRVECDAIEVTETAFHGSNSAKDNNRTMMG